MRVSTLLTLAVLAFSTQPGKSARVPTSPCPSIFRYVKDSDGSHYGEINVPASSGQLLIKMYTTEPIRASGSRPKLRGFAPNEENDARSLFRVDFPRQDPMPKVDKITVDNRAVCNGNKDPSERVTSTFQLSQSSYRSSGSRNIGSGNGNGRISESSSYRNHSYTYNSRE